MCFGSVRKGLCDGVACVKALAMQTKSQSSTHEQSI